MAAYHTLLWAVFSVKSLTNIGGHMFVGFVKFLKFSGFFGFQDLPEIELNIFLAT